MLAGAILVLMAMGGTLLKRLPFTTSIIYLGAGVLLGPLGLGLLHPRLLHHAPLLERITEVAVIISLFTAGLKLRMPLGDAIWRPPVLLATVVMVVTVFAIAAYGSAFLGLSLGAAVLLGAVLAPTDPVLASDVQTRNPYDSDSVRFTLTGEAGLNDGTAFPFVMLGLGLMGLHQLGPYGVRWVGMDLVYATAMGLAVGGGLGWCVARLVLYLRQHHKEAVGLDDFLALGLIALSYGAALAVHAYGFLAVFAAGLAIRRIERHSTPGGEQADSTAKVDPGLDDGEADEPEVDLSGSEAPTDPEKAPAFMAQAVLKFNEALERIAEVVVVVIVGAMLSARLLTWENLLFAAALFLVIRPAIVFIIMGRTQLEKAQVRMVAWFGIRGIGSIYYLTYAYNKGAHKDATTWQLGDLIVTVIAASILVHGISVTPMMRRYSKDTPDSGEGAA